MHLCHHSLLVINVTKFLNSQRLANTVADNPSSVSDTHVAKELIPEVVF